MDRFNWNHPNADHYSHGYYDQAYQEYGQHTYQRETGQTSDGVAASGSSWSYPTPGQPQPNPDFNFPQWIPPSPGSDLEYLVRTPQPIPLENIIQNDVPPGPSNAQSAVKKQRRRNFAEVKEQFLAGLDKYAQGYTLKACSATIDFFSYITRDGRLQLEGRALYSKLDQKDKDRVDQAIEDRKVFNSLRPTTRTHILAGLEAYASGALLKDCSASLSFSTYFSNNGHLLTKGESLYNKLNQEDKDRVDQALKSRKENCDKVRTSFLEGLDAYANGAPLKDCSATLSFDTYVSSKGYLHDSGKALYDRLEQGDKDRIMDALRARREIHVERIATDNTPMDGFLGGLEAYASGATLKDCSATIRFCTYVTNDGRLLPPGRRLLNKLEGGEGEVLVNKALATRRKMAAEQISGDLLHFLAALEPYSKGLDLQTCAKELGLRMKKERYQKLERYLTPEGGLTAKGELLIENLPPNQQNDVWNKVRLRRQLLDPSAQVPESPWRLPEIPSSMPEMGWMDQAAMTDPMQTEATWATAWQLTGQAMPGPSPSAELPIPYYNREAVGADFQHQYGPYGLIAQKAPDSLISWGIVPPMLINIQGEVYRVQDMGSSSVGSTNENPYGKNFMLVPCMWGG
ncbi:MAG: hypothetical protein P8X74_13480 [Reinekea sp.]|jgi:hypothetical protein